MDRKNNPQMSIEDAYREAEASLRLEGMEPGPLYYEMKERVIAGEIDVDQAVAELMDEYKKDDGLWHAEDYDDEPRSKGNFGLDVQGQEAAKHTQFRRD